MDRSSESEATQLCKIDMSILTTHNLSKSYGAQDVFQSVSLSIPHQAKIALVGANGSGKTTILRLLADLETPTTGEIHKAKGLRVGYLPQQADFTSHGTLWEAMLGAFSELLAHSDELRALEAAMAAGEACERSMERYGRLLESFELAGGYTYEQRIDQVLAGLGFAETDYQRRLETFSGGERTRALLAYQLLDSPNLLLLDEPTNHLDIAGIEWLERYLSAWDGAMVIVAHDRTFLDTVANRVWELRFGRVTHYRGNYSAYTEQRIERVARQQAEYERQQEFIAKTEDFIARHIAGQRTREAQGRLKRLERLERLERPKEYRPMHLSLGEEVTRSGDLVLGLYDVEIGHGADAPLCRIDKVEVHRGERVALVGPNGSGKTTLVRTILGELTPLQGQVRTGANVHPACFVQGHADLDPEKTRLETILDAERLAISEARDMLGSYRFSEDDVFKQVGDLSGGEQARVALALLALKGANFLILDEPTNHLDIPSQEVLHDVLASFTGTLLFVSHDRYLVEKLGDRVWTIEDGELWDFPYGYDDYRKWRTERDGASQESEDAQTRKTERQKALAAQRAAEREIARRIQRQAELEETIDELEARLSHLETELTQASERQAIAEVHSLGLEHSEIQNALDQAIAAWTEVAA